jgi:1-acyl-sn-glycerol-3-phosphate acyltransferase
MARALQMLFFGLLVRPFVFVWVGLAVRNRERLPLQGPAIVIANHNSHLDTMVLMALFPLGLLHRVRPVAAADYFAKPGAFGWFASNVVGILAMERSGRFRGAAESIDACEAALKRGEILILFPEGSRGEPERLSTFKRGIAHLAERLPDVPVTPVFMRGLGKVLPRGDWLPVPFFCDVFVGENLPRFIERAAFMDALERSMLALSAEGHVTPWE